MATPKDTPLSHEQLREKARKLANNSPALDKDKAKKDQLLAAIDTVDSHALEQLVAMLEQEAKDWTKHLADTTKKEEALITRYTNKKKGLERKASKKMLEYDEAVDEGDKGEKAERLLKSLNREI